MLDGFTIRGGRAEGPEDPAGYYSHGGGLCCVTAQPIVRGCTFRDNQAMYGGAIGTAYSAPTITDCIIAENAAQYGGGVASGSDYPELVLRNCLIVGNTASASGAGVFADASATVAITNCTFTENQAPSGDAVSCNAFSSVALHNCIVWDRGGEYELAGSGTTVDYSAFRGGHAGSGNIPGDPLFVDAPNGNYLLFHNSPCIDAGDNAVAQGITTDLRGLPRPIHGTVDMGAYEFGSFSDFDHDADVDLADFGVFQNCFNGPNRPPKDASQLRGDAMQSQGGFASRDDEGLDSFEVTFDLQSPQAGQTIAAGDPVEWHALVTVTGDNQGLAGYMLNLFLGPDTGPEPGPDGI